MQMECDQTLVHNPNFILQQSQIIGNGNHNLQKGQYINYKKLEIFLTEKGRLEFLTVPYNILVLRNRPPIFLAAKGNK